MEFSTLILACRLLSLVAVSDALRILAIFPMAAKSHFSCNEAMMKSLHAAGHHITFVSPFPSENQIENYTMVDSRFQTFVYVGQSSLNELHDIPLGKIMTLMSEVDVQYCYDVMKLKAIQEALNSTEKLYDVMFIELLVAYRCYLPIAEKLGIPVIGTVTLRSWKPADFAIGFPNNPAIIPLELSDSKSVMTFTQRLLNLWDNLHLEYLYHTLVAKKVQTFLDAHFPDPELQYKKKISIVFYNSHASLLPRPTIPSAVDIGGIHIKPAKPLPQDIQKFIDESEHGVVLFTFGSVVKASSMPVELRTSFVNAFAAIPQRVIWKFEDSIEDLSDNVMLSSWLPQRDILENKNVRAFISHCGMSGTYEAVHTGVPVIAIPVFADQQSNAALLEGLGVSVRLDLKTVTTGNLLNALNTILNDTGYYQRMQKLSRVFKDRPMTPQESVVYWTEYVVRHNGASYLEAVGTDMPMYQYLMLDILGFVAVLLSVTLYSMFYVVKTLYTMILRSPKHLIPVGNEKKMH